MTEKTLNFMEAMEEALAIWMDKTYGRPYILECVSTRASEEDVT